MLLDLGYNGNASLHFLAAYQAVRPLSSGEIQMLLAYLSYPHEWAKGLDELTRGRPILRATGALAQIEKKHEWLEWLTEKLMTKAKHREGGMLDMEKKNPKVLAKEVVHEDAQSPKDAQSPEDARAPEEDAQVAKDAQAPEDARAPEEDAQSPEDAKAPEEDAQAPKDAKAPEHLVPQDDVQEVERPAATPASIVWKPFPRALGEKPAPSEDCDETDEEMPE